MEINLTQEDFERLYQGGHHDFSNMRFDHVNIENKDLSDCDFQKSVFYYCNFHDVSGNNVNFSYTTFWDSSFDTFELSAVRFDYADFYGRFQSGSFKNLSCESCNFNPPHAEGNSAFSDVNIEKGNFENCNMRDLHITECGLRDIQIEECSCQGLHVYVDRVNSFDNPNVFDTVYFKKCEMQKAALRVYMRNVIMSEVEAEGSNWQGSRLMLCDIRSSTLSNANLRNCTLNADFFDVEAQKADFSGSNIYQCKIRECNFAESNYTKVNLKRMTFHNTNLEQVDFDGAKMNGAYFTNVQVTGVKNLESASLTMGGATSEEVENYERIVLETLKGSSECTEEAGKQISFDPEGNPKIEVKAPKEPKKEMEILQNTVDTELSILGQISDTSRHIVSASGYGLDPTGKVITAPKKTEPPVLKLSASIVKKLNIMKKEGFPARICPNGQVYLDPNHLRYFKRDELQELERYYENKIGKAFVPDPECRELSDNLKKKVHLLEQSLGDKLTLKPDGRVVIPLLQLRYFKNEEISSLCSYFANHVRELGLQTQREYPEFSGKINQKLAYLDQKGMPIRICPNGQVYISDSELKYFKREELQEINQYYAKEAAKNFKEDSSTKQLPEPLKSKLRNMELNSGKKIIVSQTGKATIPPEFLQSFTDQEISTLNSYCINQKREKVVETSRCEAPEP